MGLPLERTEMNRLRAAVLLALLAAPLGCDPKDTGKGGQTPPPPPSTTTPVTDRGTSEERNPVFEQQYEAFYKQPHDKGDTLVVGAIGDADSLNDLISSTKNADEIIGLLFLTLTSTNPDFSHGPSLAKSWEFSKDHMELTFKLRDDVYWTDGVKTTAHDVVFTHSRQIDPAIGWSAIKWKEHIKEVVALDDTTVKYVFSKLYPYQLMDAAVGSILPKHILEKVPPAEWKSHEFNRKPVGNGPFKLKEWKANQFLEIEANDKYYRGRPPLDRIIFKVILDQESLVLQLKNGEIDFMEGVPPRFYKELSKVKHLTAQVYPSRNYAYIGWNLKMPLFQSRKVRHALTMAINRPEIISALFFEFGEVCKGPVSPIIWAFNPGLKDFPFDPAKAKALLAEEGWKDTDGDGWLDKDGKRFEFSLKTNKGNQIREDIAVIVQDQLKKVGIKVNLNLLEWTIFSGDMNKKNFEASIAGWSVGLKMEMTTIFHTKSIPDKFNFVSYSNPEFDALNDAAAGEMDREKAKAMWFKAQELIVEDQPYTFLYIPKQINFIHNRFKNVRMETVGWQYNLEQWWVPKAEQKYK
jgi:peptide/nickel transport system substrate-binding protein